jgi:hypothetical protein
MRRVSVAAILVLLLALIELLFAIPAAAQSIDPASIQANYDTWLADHAAQLNKAIQDWQAANGAAPQLLANTSDTLTYSSSDIGLGGGGIGVIGTSEPTPTPEPTSDPALGTSPTDSSSTWLAVFPAVASDPPPVTIAIDIYDGPSGKGYVIRSQYCLDGQCYLKIENHGPETWRSHDWQLIVTVEPISQ